MVENSPSVVYNDYCKILRTNRGFKLKVLNFYGSAGIGKSTIAADIFSKLKRKGHAWLNYALALYGLRQAIYTGICPAKPAGSCL